jgi:hypothetical protein
MLAASTRPRHRLVDIKPRQGRDLLTAFKLALTRGEQGYWWMLLLQKYSRLSFQFRPLRWDDQGSFLIRCSLAHPHKTADFPFVARSGA